MKRIVYLVYYILLTVAYIMQNVSYHNIYL